MHCSSFQSLVHHSQCDTIRCNAMQCNPILIAMQKTISCIFTRFECKMHFTICISPNRKTALPVSFASSFYSCCAFYGPQWQNEFAGSIFAFVCCCVSVAATMWLRAAASVAYIVLVRYDAVDSLSLLFHVNNINKTTK